MGNKDLLLKKWCGDAGPVRKVVRRSPYQPHRVRRPCIISELNVKFPRELLVQDIYPGCNSDK